MLLKQATPSPSTADLQRVSLRVRVCGFICGTSVETLKKDPIAFEVARRSLKVRTTQTIRSLVLVAGVGLSFLWAFWGRLDPLLSCTWYFLVVATMSWRAYVSGKVRSRLSSINAEGLALSEADLVPSAILLATFIGSGFWLFCASGDQRTTLAITLLSCIFAVGTTVNTVAQTRILTLMVVLNLGQGIACYAMQGVRFDYASVLQLVALIIVLISFGRRLKAMFIEQVTSDLEVKMQNEKLTQSQIDIEQALAEAVKANNSKSEFLAATSHDLSQPLHAMSMFIASLKPRVEGDAEQKDLIGKIEKSADILKNQFDALLDMSRYDVNGVDVRNKSFDLYALCELLVDSERPLALAKNLDIKLIGEPVLLNSDPVLMGRMISNLIANAIKYTDSGSVAVEVLSNNEKVSLSVTDTGCGIQHERKAHIFDDFVQIGNPSRTAELGVGLGLSIVRRIADLLDVDVAVESTFGSGSTFTLDFPRHTKAVIPRRVASDMSTLRDQGAVTASDKSLDLSGLTVLLVDDSPSILDALRVYVSAVGGNPLCAHSYEEALHIAQDVEVNFAIVDDMLGEGRSGLDLARRLARDIAIKHIIIVTGNIMQDRIEILKSSGFGVYSKPLSVKQLNNILADKLDLNDITPSPVVAAAIEKPSPEPVWTRLFSQEPQ